MPPESPNVAQRERQAEAAKHVGTIVDEKYDICQLIAVGGVGAVYRARHRFTGRQVALKLLKDQFSRDRAMAERFLREAKSAAEIGHPSIIDVVDAGVDEAVGVYVAFELLEGVDLSAALKSKTLTIGQILDVADAVLDALEAAHRAGVIHRDIKPPNIFLVSGERGELGVRVLDFGAAKRQQVAPEDSLTVVGTVIGTPAYMSPEQASAAPVDPRTDVWSVGAVLFRAFADRTPFAASSPSLLLACIIRDTAPSLATFRPDLPPSLIAVVDRALERSPELRWQSAGEMRDALRAARESATVLPPVRLEQPTIPDVAPNDASTIEDVPRLEKSRRSWTRSAVVGTMILLGTVGGVLAYAAWAPAVTVEPAKTSPSNAAASRSAGILAPPISPLPTASSAEAPSASVSAAAAATDSAPPPPTSSPVRQPPKAEATSTSRRRVVPIREYE